MDLFTRWITMVVSRLCAFVWTSQIVYSVQFILCQLYSVKLLTKNFISWSLYSTPVDPVAQSLSGVWLFVTPRDSISCQTPPSVRISQARILVWVAISSSRGSSRPRDQTRISCVSCTGRFFTTEPPGKSCPYGGEAGGTNWGNHSKSTYIGSSPPDTIYSYLFVAFSPFLPTKLPEGRDLVHCHWWVITGWKKVSALGTKLLAGRLVWWVSSGWGRSWGALTASETRGSMWWSWGTGVGSQKVGGITYLHPITLSTLHQFSVSATKLWTVWNLWVSPCLHYLVVELSCGHQGVMGE